ncbi:MAG: membrane protein insertase YidC [Rhodospirillales bacterium]|nr:membrane protein insertase YidC [Rhodospirillales bacterium]MSP80106.1 membrane protein insertase YidC [Rhodospirillales bacterium]
MPDNRNMILAVILSILIVIGFEYYFSRNRPPAPAPSAPATSAPVAGVPAPGAVAVPPAAPPVPGLSGVPVPAAASVAGSSAGAGPRIQIETPTLKGSLALEGARFDDLVFTQFFEKPGRKGAQVAFFLPKGHKSATYAQVGWVGSEGVAVPTAETVWTTNQNRLAPESPVTLTWDNGQGLRFEIVVAVDKQYMFTVTQRVVNASARAATLHTYGLIVRAGTPVVSDIYILHEGPLGVLHNTLKETTYADLRKKGTEEDKSRGGWSGITDKYWLAALIPDQATEATHRFLHRKEGTEDRYQADFLQGAIVAQPGAAVETRTLLFAGAKELALLDSYGEKLNIPRFDLAIDFGWFYFLTKPIFYALVWLNQLVGNFGVAILLLTVGIKILFYPLANKSYVAMSKMKKLQPGMMKLRERHGDDKVRMNQELMALYKRENANPAAGCLPILVQIPVFFALYKVLYVTIEMRHAPFYGWIADLSDADPTTIFNLFGLIPWQPPEILMVGIWPLIMGVTMWVQQKMNPQPTDPIQAKMFAYLPIIFTYMLASFPAGLVIYWAWNNVLSMAQQWVIMRRMGVQVT